MSSIFPGGVLRCKACGEVQHEMDWAANIVMDDDPTRKKPMGTPHWKCLNCGALDTAEAVIGL